MTTIIFEAKRRLALAAFLTTVSLASYAALPDGEFACQVLTASGQSGLVLVQTDAEVDAVPEFGRVSGHKTVSRAEEVVELGGALGAGVGDEDLGLRCQGEGEISRRAVVPVAEAGGGDEDASAPGGRHCCIGSRE